jgi:hypothetical protein
LVWDPAWFSPERTPAQVQATIAYEWDCSAAVEVGELRLCPRRSTPHGSTPRTIA